MTNTCRTSAGTLPNDGVRIVSNPLKAEGRSRQGLLSPPPLNVLQSICGHENLPLHGIRTLQFTVLQILLVHVPDFSEIEVGKSFPAWFGKLCFSSAEQVTSWTTLIRKPMIRKKECKKVEGRGKWKGRRGERRKGNCKWSFVRNEKNSKRPSRESNPGPQQTRLMLYHWATETSHITSQFVWNFIRSASTSQHRHHPVPTD